MGIFGGSKDKKVFRLTDFFSAEEINSIRDILGPKLAAGEYGAIGNLTAKGLLEYAERADRELSYKKFGNFFKIAETVKQIEPSLSKILEDGFGKFTAAGSE